jgi:hypothetical protein
MIDAGTGLVSMRAQRCGCICCHRVGLDISCYCIDVVVGIQQWVSNAKRLAACDYSSLALLLLSRITNASGSTGRVLRSTL